MELEFDAKVTSVIAIEKACYRFSDRFASVVSTTEDSITVAIDFLVAPDEQDFVIRQFKTEVLDQSLREKIAADTALERNLILSFAFSQTGLLDAK